MRLCFIEFEDIKPEAIKDFEGDKDTIVTVFFSKNATLSMNLHLALSKLNNVEYVEAENDLDKAFIIGKIYGLNKKKTDDVIVVFLSNFNLSKGILEELGVKEAKTVKRGRKKPTEQSKSPIKESIKKEAAKTETISPRSTGRGKNKTPLAQDKENPALISSGNSSEISAEEKKEIKNTKKEQKNIPITVESKIDLKESAAEKAADPIKKDSNNTKQISPWLSDKDKEVFMKLSNISDFDLADSIAQAIFETENVNEALKVIKKKSGARVVNAIIDRINLYASYVKNGFTKTVDIIEKP